MCVWVLMKTGRAWKQRGNHVLGVGLRYWGARGYPPVLMGSAPAAFSTWVSTASGCRSHRPSGGSSWQVLRAGLRAFEAAQVDGSPKSFGTVIPCWLCRMDCITVLWLQERRL